jgi:hypothetical protein
MEINMQIEKISSKYSISQEGVTFTVDMGNVKNAEDKTVNLFISGVEDGSKVTLHPKCGCTVPSERVDTEDNKVLIKFTYEDCEDSFTKTIVVKYSNVQIGIIKLKGKCQ